MPLDKSKSKQAFSHNVEAEMHAGKPQKQALAIAYNVKKHMKKKSMGGKMEGYADGGMVENEDLNPRHEDPEARATSSLDSLHQDSMKQNHDQPMATPAEPKDHVLPQEENMGRNNPIGERIMRAVNMAMGGRIDEHDGMHSPDGVTDQGGEDLPHGQDENRALAMNDTYPPGKAESDTQAQDENFGDGPMDNEEMPMDQEEARRDRMRRSLGMSPGRLSSSR